MLNLCRVLQALTDREVYPYSKDEGGAWGLRRLPERFRPLIAAVLDVYHAETPVREAQRETGGSPLEPGGSLSLSRLRPRVAERQRVTERKRLNGASGRAVFRPLR